MDASTRMKPSPVPFSFSPLSLFYDPRMLSLRALPRAIRSLKPPQIRSLATTTSIPPSEAQTRPSDAYVKLVEVGARDGLQNEKKTISTATKIELIRRLAKTGLRDIEAGSFVSPKWVPQVSSFHIPQLSNKEKIINANWLSRWRPQTKC